MNESREVYLAFDRGMYYIRLSDGTWTHSIGMTRSELLQVKECLDKEIEDRLSRGKEI